MNKETMFPFRQNTFEDTVDLTRRFNGKLRIAIPSRGELTQGSVDFLGSLGYDMTLLTKETRKLAVQVDGNTIVYKLRAPDIIDAFRRGSLDIAILGADIIFEEQLGPNPPPIEVGQYLGFGGCSFRIGFPFDRSIPTGNEIRRKLETGRIATSLPNTLKFILAKENIFLSSERIITLTGSLEAAIALYPDVFAIADRVSSGDTMLANTIRPDLALIEFPGAYLVQRYIPYPIPSELTNDDYELRDFFH